MNDIELISIWESIRRPGRVGILVSLLSFILLWFTLEELIDYHTSIYFFGIAQDYEGPIVPISEIFQLPIIQTPFTNNLPFPPITDQKSFAYYTQSCQSPNAPQSIKFSLSKLYSLQEVYVLLNLRDTYPFMNNQDLNGQRVGWIAFEYGTNKEEEKYDFYDLYAGRNIRDWFDTRSAGNLATPPTNQTSEAFYGVDKNFGKHSVIDMITIPFESELSPNTPVTAIWIGDTSIADLESCDPGFQVINVIVKVRKGPNS